MNSIKLLSPARHPRATRLGIACFLLACAVSAAFAFSGNPPNGYAGDPPSFNTCVACHSSFPLNSGAGSLQIQGLPAEYIPGVIYPLTIVLADPSRARWGFEATVIREDSGMQAGDLAAVDPSLVQVSAGAGDLRDYIKQRSAGTFPGQQGQAFWEILWTAPSAGTGTALFYLAGNAANNNGQTSGDYIYSIDAGVPEAPPTAVGEPVAASRDLILSPNPVSREAAITFRLSSPSVADLLVLDAAGRRVRRLASGPLAAGAHHVRWNLLDELGLEVPAGVYYVLLRGGDRKQTLRLAVVR